MLTNGQLQTIKTLIANTPAMASQPNSGDGNSAVAALLNATASPDYWVWRGLVQEAEIYEQTSPDGTTWSWTTYIAQTLAEQGAWRQMVSMRGGMNPSLANVRAGVASIFAGGGAGPTAQRAHLLSISRRKATVAEKALATGAGSIASPATSGVDNGSGVFSITYQEVEQARNLS